jgi:hypothetical protein
MYTRSPAVTDAVDCPPRWVMSETFHGGSAASAREDGNVHAVRRSVNQNFFTRPIGRL